MRPYCLLLLFCLVLAVPLTLSAQTYGSDDNPCSENTRSAEYVDEVCEVRTLTLPARAELAVDGGPNGGIRVQGWERDDIVVQVGVRAYSEDAATAQKLVDDVTISTGKVIEAVFPRTRGEDWVGASYRIYVPYGTDLDLRTTNGGIRITAVQSRIRFNTANGGVRLKHLGGDVQGRTSNGSLKIELEGATWNGHGLDVSSGNGSINLVIPDDYSARIESSTGNGRLHVDFPITVQGRIDHRVDFTLGEGGPLLRARTGNGRVHIERG